MTKENKEHLLKTQGYYYKITLIWPDGKETTKEFGNWQSAFNYMKAMPQKFIEKVER